LNNKEENDSSFEGKWFKSGDIAIIHSDGRIQIIDRIKNLFKLAQGEYIAPEKIENVIAQSPLFLQN